MKKIFLTLAFACSALWGQAQVYYGYSPNSAPDASQTTALGSGENGNMCITVKLDPTSDPVMQRLKGKKLLGVRCYLRTPYEQEFDERSSVTVYEGSLEGAPTRKFVDFKEGWNDVYFDNPITISDKPLYVGYQVLEMISSPYPAVAFSPVTVPNSCWVRLGLSGKWQEFTDRGTPLIQAILEDDARSALDRSAYALVASAPLTMAPSQPASMQVYVRNFSSAPVSNMQVQSLGQGDKEPKAVDVDFSTPLAAYDGRMVNLQVAPGSEEGPSQWLSLNVAKMNGEATQTAMTGTTKHYITRDAYVRIPLIEEFTSQRCPNCPYLAYYLDMARDEFPHTALYVSHHSGFAKDAFSTKADEDLLYLFNDQEKGAFNPAITYNRSYLTGENFLMMNAHKEPSPSNYLEDLTEALNQPAMAKVLVDTKENGGQLECTVSGQVNRHLVAAGTPLYLTAYLVEDSLTTADYPQDGLDVDDIPADLVARFRHNGVIRHSFTTTSTGDRLDFDGDASFSVKFPAVTISDKWAWKNCQVIAFVHNYDPNNLHNNTILNAGGNRVNHIATGINQATAENAANVVCAFAGADRRLRTSQPVEGLVAYTLSGARVNTALPLAPGVYLVQCRQGGRLQTAQKVIVR